MAQEEATRPPLPDDERLFRSVDRGGIIDFEDTSGNPVKFLAFMLRPDEQGLSVSLTAGRSDAAVVDGEKVRVKDPKSVRAIYVVTAQQVRALSGTPLPSGGVVTLTLHQDRDDHADILGLPQITDKPLTTEEVKAAYRDAEYMGGKLADIAKVFWDKRNKFGTFKT